MFSRLTEFKYKRSPAEAIGFYISYLFIIVILSILITGAIGLFVPIDFSQGVNIGTLVASISVLYLSFSIAKAKCINKQFTIIIIIIIAPVIALFIGGLGGLIPVSYLTTLNDNT